MSSWDIYEFGLSNIILESFNIKQELIQPKIHRYFLLNTLQTHWGVEWTNLYFHIRYRSSQKPPIQSKEYLFPWHYKPTPYNIIFLKLWPIFIINHFLIVYLAIGLVPVWLLRQSQLFVKLEVLIWYTNHNQTKGELDLGKIVTFWFHDFGFWLQSRRLPALGQLGD